MKTGKIYIITNDVNDKVYIGQTVQSLNRRLSQHFCKSKTRNQKISIAIREIGKEHFSIKLLEDNIEQNKLKEKEEEYIKKYNSVENGYNLVYRDEYSRATKDFTTDMIIKDYQNGMTMKNIGKKYHMCKKTVSHLLKQYNIPIRNWNELQSVGITKEYLQREYIDKKRAISDIAKEVGLSGTAIRNWIKKFNL